MPTANEMIVEHEQENEDEDHYYYMRQAHKVAEAALDIGEVPVGCVIVLPTARGSVIVSHGANQVNANRDATRHAELVAIDRMLTGAVSSDQLRLPRHIIANPAKRGDTREENGHNDESRCDNCKPSVGEYTQQQQQQQQSYDDKWVNVPENPEHWKNSYGWGSGRLYNVDVLSKCRLYVTCEPCIMCAAALAEVRIGKVYFGCRNDKFGGCGSILSLHQSNSNNDNNRNPPPAAGDDVPSNSAGADDYHGYPVVSGILKDEAVNLLRSFYNRENFHAPEDKRKRKDNKQEGKIRGC